MVQVTSETLTDWEITNQSLQFANKTQNKIQKMQLGPPAPPENREPPPWPSSSSPGTKPLGSKKKGCATVSPSKGLLLEVEETPDNIAGVEKIHLLAIRVGSHSWATERVPLSIAASPNPRRPPTPSPAPDRQLPLSAPRRHGGVVDTGARKRSRVQPRTNLLNKLLDQSFSSTSSHHRSITRKEKANNLPTQLECVEE